MAEVDGTWKLPSECEPVKANSKTDKEGNSMEPEIIDLTGSDDEFEPIDWTKFVVKSEPSDGIVASISDSSSEKNKKRPFKFVENQEPNSRNESSPTAPSRAQSYFTSPSSRVDIVERIEAPGESETNAIVLD